MIIVEQLIIVDFPGRTLACRDGAVVGRDQAFPDGHRRHAKAAAPVCGGVHRDDTSSHEKLPYILGMYEALSDASPSLLLVLYGEHKALVSERIQGTLTNLGDLAKTMTRGLVAKVVLYDSSHGLWGADDGVHPLTRYVMTRVEQELAPYRTVLGLILATSGDVNGAAERVTTFGGLVEELIEALERNLEKISALNAGGSASAAAHLFLANNISFVLNRAADADVAPVLGDEWVALRRSKLERHAAS
ncbi:hypothetical protein QOZ80_1BG0093510 [Eleusine coracana subsp. coracana]|nr:hypothetical protein QOZ80_1BG0093510 [Eleusine coracana subsp. coracana]